MELITCVNGHRYDRSITPECPECARLRYAASLNNGNGGTDEYSKTVPVNAAPSSPSQAKTVPLNAASRNHWAEAGNYVSAGQGGAESYPETMPIDYDGKAGSVSCSQRVTGWLVCIDGPEKGTDYRLHGEYNYIGRGSKMDVCIAGDPTVSYENHAIIAYDSREKTFYFSPAGGASIVRHNGRAALSSVELKHGDRVEIGQGTFLFVALCGENFQWES